MFKIILACALVAFGVALVASPVLKENPHAHVIGADVKITLNGEPSEFINL